jgi:hypothetical protein
LTIVEELHAARKARLERMGALPRYQAPVISVEKAPVKPQPADAGWECMWFFDLLQSFKEPRQTVAVREIINAVCKHYNVTVFDLMSQRRTKDISLPRQVAMYFCRNLTPHSFAEIGRRFGGRDHSTALHATQKIEGLLGYDIRLTADVNTLRRVLA